MRRVLVLPIVLIVALSVAVAASSGGGDASRPGKPPSVFAGPSPSAQLVRAITVADYAHGLEVQRVADYLVAVQRDEVAAFLASLPSPSAAVELDLPPAPAAEATHTIGASGACGGATNGADQFIQRESGGDPNAYNPSGAWGCYQIMPGTWAGAGCDQFGAYGSASASAQAQCASRLPMSAWAY